MVEEDHTHPSQEPLVVVAVVVAAKKKQERPEHNQIQMRLESLPVMEILEVRDTQNPVINVTVVAAAALELQGVRHNLASLAMVE